MHLTNDTIVDAVLAVEVVLVIYDSTGTLIPGMAVITLYSLEALPSSCIFGIPFLSVYNLPIDWGGYTAAFSSLVVMCLSQ